MSNQDEHLEPPLFHIKPYEFEDLVGHFVDERPEVGRTKEIVLGRTNALALYFRDYLKECKAATMVVENQYVDLDFLQDFAAYYVHCFNELPKYAKRIHFFANTFTEGEFIRALKRDNQALLEALRVTENYIGFVVVKPLPATFIGRTCLRTYPTFVDNGARERRYPIRRTYSANLFGIPLSVESIPFQEQDEEVSACATSALWSMFHGSQQMFSHPVPSPHAITLSASDRIPDWQFSNPDTRRFPNGLTNAQMASAIRDVGLEAYLIGLKSPDLRKEAVRKPDGATAPFLDVRQGLSPAVYAYLSGEIPVVLTGKLVERVDDKDLSETAEHLKKKISGDTSKQIDIGDHAMTVLGFGVDWKSNPEPIKFHNCQAVLRAMRIDRLYVHDDQIGPFARMAWQDSESLDTSWYYLNKRKVFFQPQCVFVPLTEQIRITYEIVQESIIELNELIRSWVHQRSGEQVEWEIRLLTVNKFKSELMVDGMRDVELRQELLTKHLPKYLWVVTGWLHGSSQKFEKYIDFVVDATALEQEGGLRVVIAREEFLQNAFFQGIKLLGVLGSEPRTLTRKVIEYYRELQ